MHDLFWLDVNSRTLFSDLNDHGLLSRSALEPLISLDLVSMKLYCFRARVHWYYCLDIFFSTNPVRRSEELRGSPQLDYNDTWFFLLPLTLQIATREREREERRKARQEERDKEEEERKERQQQREKERELAREKEKRERETEKPRSRSPRNRRRERSRSRSRGPRRRWVEQWWTGMITSLPWCLFIILHILFV